MMGCEIIYHEGETSTNVNTGVANTDFIFKHPDSDTMMLSVYAKLRMGNINGAVVLDSEDTDVYVQAAYLSQQLPCDLIIKYKHVFINCSAMLPDEVS